MRSATVILLLTAHAASDHQINDLDWWKCAIYYQIYPRSFKDSNNDGIGDLQGIIEKLDHFPKSGIDAVWLSPIFKSPQVDQGYDISNYTDIEPDYGTIDDLKELIEKAHEKGVKVILDFVPNHTSDQHQWFIDSINGVEEYRDYYVWADAKIDDDGQRQPPNNWISVFKKSAWTWNEKRQQYYLHQFASAQPDLNFYNPKVIEAMNEVLKFWLALGVDGFRIDAVPHIFEDKELRDEPPTGIAGFTDDDYEYRHHIYTKDQPENYNLIYSWRKLVDDYTNTNGGDQRVLMTEAYADINHTMLFYGTPDGDQLGAHFTFNFFLIVDLNLYSTAQDIVNSINKWLDAIPEIYISNWVIGNHDNPRVATRFGRGNVDGFNMLTSVLPGILVTYNGEEIGQENGEVSYEEGQDPAARNPEIFYKVSRDFERTPYHWDDSTNAGFNTGAKPWLPVSEKYLETNLQQQQETDKPSHYKIYQALAKLRTDPILKSGDVEVKAIAEYVVFVKRSYDDSSFALIFNKGGENVTVNIENDIPLENNIVIKNVDSLRELGSSIDSTNLNLDAHEALILSSLSLLAICALANGCVAVDLDWWKHAVFYQIYPRSFEDSNNDGIGDLQGIIKKLDLFPSLGVDAIWLSPIFKSPQVDQGYDISDYRSIDPDYGTVEDLVELIQEAHTRGIRVILDFVPNHTSDKHQWFIDSENGVEEYRDFYVWADAKVDEEGNRVPPNNWLSNFKNSSWEWSEKRQQYYLHQFMAAQPDLNYNSPKVVEAMKDVLKFWLDHGVDGFRIDAVPFLFEDEDLRDEPESGRPGYNDTDWEYLNHIYTQDLPGTYDMVYQWRQLVDDYTQEHGTDQKVLMTESYTTPNNTVLYYGTLDGSRLGAHFTFNFNLIQYVNINSTAQDIVNTINDWINILPEIYTSNWVLGNHDNHRIATRLGPGNVDGFNMLNLLLPGVGVTYNGEEIGQENGEVSYEEGKDPSARDPAIFYEVSRDFERTPYQWDTSINAGFNTGAEPWLPVSKKYLETNLKQQQETEGSSHYKIYQNLTKIRTSSTIRLGDVETEALDENVILIKRSYDGSSVALVFNKGNESVTVNVEEYVAYENTIVIKSVKSYREV
ncbi:maltase 2, partial [Asbolus verrucosus]